MVSNGSRVIATAFIWFMAALILGILKDSVSSFNLVVLAGMVLLTVGLSTRWVWNSGAQPVAAEVSPEKAKRIEVDRVSRLVESLSDDELDHLRARLSEQERMVPLDDLLRDRR